MTANLVKCGYFEGYPEIPSAKGKYHNVILTEYHIVSKCPTYNTVTTRVSMSTNLYDGFSLYMYQHITLVYME